MCLQAFANCICADQTAHMRSLIRASTDPFHNPAGLSIKANCTSWPEHAHLAYVFVCSKTDFLWIVPIFVMWRLYCLAYLSGTCILINLRPWEDFLIDITNVNESEF